MLLLRAAPALLLLSGLAAAQGAVRVPLDAPTIADALPLAGEGGVIHVAEGPQAGGFVVTQTVTIEGGYPPAFDGPPDPQGHPTIVDAPPPGAAATFVLGPGDQVVTRGFVFSGSTLGVEATLAFDSILTLDQVTFTGNELGGRFVVSDLAAVFLTAANVTGNVSAGEGAGLEATTGGQALFDITGAVFSGNRADGGAAALLLHPGGDSATFVRDALFEDNGYGAAPTATGAGTLRYTSTGGSLLFVQTSTFRSNVAAVPGGAAIGGTQTGSTLVQLDTCTLEEGAGGAGGEALDATLTDTCALRLVDCELTATTNLLGPMVRVVPDGQANVTITGCNVHDLAGQDVLIAAEMLGGSFFNVDQNVFRNVVTNGPVLDLHTNLGAAGALVRVINNVFDHGVSLGVDGGVRAWIEGSNVGQVGYNSFYANAAAGGAAGLHLIADFSPGQAANNVLFQNTVAGAPADLLVEGFLAKDLGNWTTADGDPQWVAPMAGDFHLAEGSPVIDAGDSTAFQIDHDFEDDARPYGATADPGADEYLPATGSIYCTSQPNSLGCTPAIDFQGVPSASAGNGFEVTASGLLNNQFGILFYGTTAANDHPFHGGTLCVAPPIVRTPIQNSGGTAPPFLDCTGAFTFDFNAWIASGHDASLAPGTQVWAQYWSRDPFSAPFGDNLTNAVTFVIAP